MTGPRFLKLADVAEPLNISGSQTYALVRAGDLPAIKIGGGGQWRRGRAAGELRRPHVRRDPYPDYGGHQSASRCIY
jgi:hypothetical protein